MKNIQVIKKKIISDLKSVGIKSAEIDAQILLEFVSEKSREFLLSHHEHKLSEKELELLPIIVDRRKSEVPIAYITGHKEFYGLDFEVNSNVLIPRPETEQLVEIALQFIQSNCHSELVSESNKMPNQVRHDKLKILDVGTGSGNIIISLAKNINGDFLATDISKKALDVAKKNAKKHKANIKFIQSDLFKNISEKFDLIVANLPYVPIGGSSDKEIQHEPQKAIFAEDNGSAIIKRFLSNASDYLNDDGIILLEVDPRNAKSLATYAAKLFSSVEIIKDYSNKLRFLKIF